MSYEDLQEVANSMGYMINRSRGTFNLTDIHTGLLMLGDPSANGYGWSLKEIRQALENMKATGSFWKPNGKLAV